ncbi:DUF4124 domain-containing protein [Marinobacter sp. 2_MG-2023]|uniref:DUF4124 domain-containing protein n=1 Tax=Marinobacter sp. 2_MG-2023 TaxID=3062679 RepID=UPI0026E1671F|nr:DUF4124 domain-containing protein [Marinobacter sp. 2_MG-2023]MDO6441531.1 DUF4124 domain-containing protein [Marinobacter sp. 2_MG-2023]
MLRLLIGLVFPLVFATATQAEVFRCSDAEGNTVFSDTPCGENAEAIQIRDNRIGGRFNQNLPASSAAKPEPHEKVEKASEAGSEPETCRFINSTDLRRYLIREQVVKGMTREHVRSAFGNPPETYGGPQEVWIYQTDYYGALYELTYVYFKDGCVERVEYRKP